MSTQDFDRSCVCAYGVCVRERELEREREREKGRERGRKREKYSDRESEERKDMLANKERLRTREKEKKLRGPWTYLAQADVWNEQIRNTT